MIGCLLWWWCTVCTAPPHFKKQNTKTLPACTCKQNCKDAMHGTLVGSCCSCLWLDWVGEDFACLAIYIPAGACAGLGGCAPHVLCMCCQRIALVKRFAAVCSGFVGMESRLGACVSTCVRARMQPAPSAAAMCVRTQVTVKTAV